MKRQHCKQVLERHFKAPFRKGSINGFNIDFYNSSLMIGLQYNSVYHYKFSLAFHKTYTKFKETQKKDILRKQMCKEAGIRLISIPYNVGCVSGTLGRMLGKADDCRCSECLITREAVRIKQS